MSTLSEQQLASFLGLFSGIVGLCELVTQWFFSSRLIERIGVFVTAALLPITVGFVLTRCNCLTQFIPDYSKPKLFLGFD